MNTAIQFFGSTTGFIPLASPMEPETTRTILNYRPRPKVVDQFNIDGWVKDIKTAAGLPHGTDNLGTVFDVAYLFGVNGRENSKVDFVTGTKKAVEVPGYTHLLVFTKNQGFIGNTTSTAIDSGWNINTPGNLGTPGGHHYHLSSLVSNTGSSTSFWSGTSDFHTVPLQTVSGIRRFRIRSGSSALVNFDNDNIKGAYTIKRKLSNQVSYQKNNNAEITASNSGSSYPDINFFILGIHDAITGLPSTMRSGVLTGSFTAGAKEVDGGLLALADRNYFLNYGIDLFDV